MGRDPNLPARVRRSWRLIAAVLCIAALVGHFYFWYGARARPALPNGGLPARLLHHPELPLAVWIPFPHQNLGALEDFGLDTGTFQAALRLAALPSPALPRFGNLRVPPSRSLAIATDRAGKRFVVAADVYPTAASFFRLAGRLAGNPWLAGGDLLTDEGRLSVHWHGNVWTVSSQGAVSFVEGGTFPPSFGRRDKGPLSSPGRRPVLVAEARSTRKPLPEGRYYLFVDDQGIELVSDLAKKRPPTTSEVMAQARALLLAVSAADGPLGAGGQAMALIGQASDQIAELPRGAVIHRPGIERWGLPAEGLLSMAGRKPSSGSVAGLKVVATDSVGLSQGQTLAPEVEALLGSPAVEDALVFGLWVELSPAAGEVSRIRRGLERAPLWSREQLVRWREADRFLAGLAAPWQRMELVVRGAPATLWLRVE